MKVIRRNGVWSVVFGRASYIQVLGWRRRPCVRVARYTRPPSVQQTDEVGGCAIRQIARVATADRQADSEARRLKTCMGKQQKRSYGILQGRTVQCKRLN